MGQADGHYPVCYPAEAGDPGADRQEEEVSLPKRPRSEANVRLQVVPQVPVPAARLARLDWVLVAVSQMSR